MENLSLFNVNNKIYESVISAIAALSGSTLSPLQSSVLHIAWLIANESISYICLKPRYQHLLSSIPKPSAFVFWNVSPIGGHTSRHGNTEIGLYCVFDSFEKVCGYIQTVYIFKRYFVLYMKRNQLIISIFYWLFQCKKIRLWSALWII